MTVRAILMPQVKQADEVALGGPAAAALTADLARFSKAVTFVAFKGFLTAAEALEEASAVSEGGMSDTLKAFLQQNLPKVRRPRSGSRRAPPCGELLARAESQAPGYG